MESRNALTLSNTDLEAERKPFTTGKAKQEMGRIKKQEWTNQIEFFLSCISYSVGLGNLWRFPYLCFEHGGMTFLIPYFTCILLCGIPMSVLESCLGQFSGNGPIQIWSMAPLFTGVGWGELLMSFYCCIYYNVIVAYALLFAWKSLPTYQNGVINTVLPYSKNSTFCQGWRDSKNFQIENTNSTVSAKISHTCQEAYYNQEILQDSGDMTSGLSSLNYQLCFSLLVAWILIFLTQIQSAKSTGKTAYITSTLPYVCLTILLIRVTMLEGASIGLEQYFSVNIDSLFTAKIWADASQQVFWSQGIAWGVLIIYASHNPFELNVYRYAWRQSLINACTSVYAGVVIFSSLGFLAFDNNGGNVELATKNFNKVIGQSQKLAFVIYPTALSQMGGASWVMAILFFVMLATLGIGSQIGIFMAVYEGVMEKFDEWSFKKRQINNKIENQNINSETSTSAQSNKLYLTLLCLLNIICAYPLVSKSGASWLSWFDSYCSHLSLQLFALIEIVSVSWIYGIDNFIQDIEFMMGRPLPIKRVWVVLWKYVTPCYTMVTLMLALVNSYNKKMMMIDGIPDWANYAGWLLPISEILFVPVLMVYYKFDRMTMPKFYGRRNEYSKK